MDRRLFLPCVYMTSSKCVLFNIYKNSLLVLYYRRWQGSDTLCTPFLFTLKCCPGWFCIWDYQVTRVWFLFFCLGFLYSRAQTERWRGSQLVVLCRDPAKRRRKQSDREMRSVCCFFFHCPLTGWGGDLFVWLTFSIERLDLLSCQAGLSGMAELCKSQN